MQEVFERYNNLMFSADKVKVENVESSIAARNLRVARMAAIVFVAINLYYLINDLIKGAYKLEYTLPNLYALLLLIISSLYIIILATIRHKNYDNRLIRFSLLAYEICIIISVTIINFTNGIRAVNSGTNLEFVGITLSSVYLLFFLVVPLYRRSDTAIVLTLMFVGMIINALLPGNEAFGIFRQVSYRLIVAAGTIYLRKQYVDLAKSELNVKRLNRELVKSSFTDGLTGALNRHALDSYIALLKKQNADIGVLIFDIDNFKLYNDKYSHKMGDEALCRVCEATALCLNDNAPFLFRFGGEEFIVLTQNMTDKEVVELGLNICKKIREANIERDDGSTYNYITVSVGCASTTAAADDYLVLVDVQLFLSKSNGKNCVAYNGVISR